MKKQLSSQKGDSFLLEMLNFLESKDSGINKENCIIIGNINIENDCFYQDLAHFLPEKQPKLQKNDLENIPQQLWIIDCDEGWTMIDTFVNPYKLLCSGVTYEIIEVMP
jgi:hypothetical protein